MEFQFRRRYSLPPTDPRWLNATKEDIWLDHYAHAHTDNPKLRDAMEDPDFEDTLAELEEKAVAAEEESAPAPRDGSVEDAPDGGDFDTVEEHRFGD